MSNLFVPTLVQAKLLDLLAIDTDVIMTQRRIREAESARIGLETDSEYARLVRDAETAEDRVDDAVRACEHIESDIAVAKARIVRNRERETATNDPKELTDLESEIFSLEVRIERLEDAQFEALEAKDEATAVRDDIVFERDSFHEVRDQKAADIQSDILAARERLDSLSRQRATLTSEFPTELVELYERQRERYGVGASFLQRGITSASGVQLSPSQLDDIRRADPDAVLICPDSNAILIRTADSGL